MSWSWRLGRVAGIDVFVHATFPLIILWVAAATWMQGGTGGAILTGIVFTLLLFGSVVLHEYGHALTARRFGIRTRDITLLPIGGVARLERMPSKPSQEFLVAIAGPAVNVVLAIGLFAFLQMTGRIEPLSAIAFGEGPLLERLAFVNLFVAAFNMLPAFPMDGGRVVRSLLASRLAYTQATDIAAALGKAMAALFALVGLLANPILLLIAAFVWFGASQEAAAVRMRARLRGYPVGSAMLTRFEVLPAGTPVRDALQLALATAQEEFPVAADGRLVGVLTKDDLAAALRRGSIDVTVRDVMHTDLRIVSDTAMLEAVTDALAESEGRPLAVVRGDRLVGLLSARNLSQFLALQATSPRRAAGPA